MIQQILHTVWLIACVYLATGMMFAMLYQLWISWRTNDPFSLDHFAFHTFVWPVSLVVGFSVWVPYFQTLKRERQRRPITITAVNAETGEPMKVTLLPGQEFCGVPYEKFRQAGNGFFELEDLQEGERGQEWDSGAVRRI